MNNDLKEIEKRVKEVVSELLDSSSNIAQQTGAVGVVQTCGASPQATADPVPGTTGIHNSPYNLDASFLELGINSVLAVELVDAMNQKLGIELGVEVMFDYRNIRELTQFIFKQYEGEYPSKEFVPIKDDVRSSAGDNVDSDEKTHVPAFEGGSSDNREIRRDMKGAVGTGLAPSLRGPVQI